MKLFRSTLRIDEITHYKLRYISEYEGRSVNSQLLRVVRSMIHTFEERHGPISMPMSDSDEN